MNSKKKKSCMVADRITLGGNNWKWKSDPVVVGLSTDLENLTRCIASTHLQSGEDQIACILTSDGKFKVDVLRKKIKKKPSLIINPLQIDWSKIIPIKVTTFIWRAVMGKIPSAMALSHRGVNVDTYSCSSCIDGLEDANHILVRCPYAISITDDILGWCGLHQVKF